MKVTFFKRKNIFSVTRVIDASKIPYTKWAAGINEKYGSTVLELYEWNTAWGIGKRKSDYPENKKMRVLSKTLISGGCKPGERIIIEHTDDV